MVPHPEAQVRLVPPEKVVPYKDPSTAWTSAPPGALPSAHPLCEQKLYTVDRAPLGVILKIVPPPWAPPPLVIP
jgi:hypothetical protein